MKRGVGPDYIPQVDNRDETKAHRTDGFVPVVNQAVPAALLTPAQLQDGQAAGLALLEAVQTQNLTNLFTLLTQSLNIIPYGYQGWALGESVKTGNETMTSLLASVFVPQIHPGQVKYAKDTARDMNRQDMIDAIERVERGPRF